MVQTTIFAYSDFFLFDRTVAIFNTSEQSELNARLLMRVESDFFHDHKIQSKNRN
jgi:hypothetical protein